VVWRARAQTRSQPIVPRRRYTRCEIQPAQCEGTRCVVHPGSSRTSKSRRRPRSRGQVPPSRVLSDARTVAHALHCFHAVLSVSKRCQDSEGERQTMCSKNNLFGSVAPDPLHALRCPLLGRLDLSQAGKRRRQEGRSRGPRSRRPQTTSRPTKPVGKRNSKPEEPIMRRSLVSPQPTTKSLSSQKHFLPTRCRRTCWPSVKPCAQPPRQRKQSSAEPKENKTHSAARPTARRVRFRYFKLRAALHSRRSLLKVVNASCPMPSPPPRRAPARQPIRRLERSLFSSWRKPCERGAPHALLQSEWRARFSSAKKQVQHRRRPAMAMG
jgi:hypothetical protein